MFKISQNGFFSNRYKKDCSDEFFLMVSDFLRRTPPRPDKIAAQTLLDVIGKGYGYSFSVLSIVPENRKYRKKRK